MATLANLCLPGGNKSYRGGTLEGTVGFGSGSLRSTNAGNCRNTAFGYRALSNSSLSGGNNTAIGALAGTTITTGCKNTLIGYNTGNAITSGISNIIIGSGGEGITSGCDNIAIGLSISGFSGNSQYRIGIGRAVQVYGDKSIAIGAGARANTCSVSIGFYTFTGNCSVALGRNAVACGCISVAIGNCSTDSGYNCGIVIGNSAYASGINSIMIGNEYTSGANTITMGNAGNNVYNCIYGGWTYCSDFNEKANIQTLSYNFGLPFIKKLRPVKFNWDIREKYVEKCGFEWGQKDGTLVEDKENYGFIAQEIETALNELNLRFDELTKDNKRYKLASTGLLAPIVKSIQQLSTKLDTIKERLTTLENN